MINNIEYVDTVDGQVPLLSLGSVETREKLSCGDGVTTKYFYQGIIVRQDYCVIVSKDALIMEPATSI